MSPQPKPTGVRADVQHVTPEQAAEWLKVNHVNRPIRQHRVEFFRRIIADNQFVMTGEPIQFTGYFRDRSHELANGQHRLIAISLGEIGVDLLVVQGIAKNAQVFMDTGAKRTFSDVLKMERGVTDPHNTAAAVRLGYIVDHRDPRDPWLKEQPSNVELLTWFDKNDTIVGAPLSNGRRLRAELGVSPAAGTVARLLFDRVDSLDAETFIQDTITGAGLHGQDPVLALRRYFMNMHLIAQRKAPRAAVQLAVFIKAWNARRRGNGIALLSYKPFVEEYPTPE